LVASHTPHAPTYCPTLQFTATLFCHYLHCPVTLYWFCPTRYPTLHYLPPHVRSHVHTTFRFWIAPPIHLGFFVPHYGCALPGCSCGLVQVTAVYGWFTRIAHLFTGSRFHRIYCGYTRTVLRVVWLHVTARFCAASCPVTLTLVLYVALPIQVGCASYPVRGLITVYSYCRWFGWFWLYCMPLRFAFTLLLLVTAFPALPRIAVALVGLPPYCADSQFGLVAFCWFTLAVPSCVPHLQVTG